MDCDRVVSMSGQRSELSIVGLVRRGDEVATLAEGLDQLAPGDILTYHKGAPGTLPVKLAEAARLLAAKGHCLLVQRIDKRFDGERRLVDYLAIKAKASRRASEVVAPDRGIATKEAK